MEATRKLIERLHIFEGLSSKDLDIINDFCEEVHYQKDEVIFSEGDPSGALFIILSGGVEISTTVFDDLQKPLVVLRSGSILGEVSLIDRNPRESKAISIEDTRLLQMTADSFDKVSKDHPDIATKMLSVITQTVVKRIRLTTEQYRQNIQWGLEVSGALNLNWQYLITDEVSIELQLQSGLKKEGRLLKVEKSDAGYEIFIIDATNQVSIVPYHSVQLIAFRRVDVMSHRSSSTKG